MVFIDKSNKTLVSIRGERKGCVAKRNNEKEKKIISQNTLPLMKIAKIAYVQFPNIVQVTLLFWVHNAVTHFLYL